MTPHWRNWKIGWVGAKGEPCSIALSELHTELEVYEVVSAWIEDGIKWAHWITSSSYWVIHD